MIIAGDRRLPYPDLHRHAACAANGFRSLGIREGDAVALLLRNDFPYLEASLAAGLIGAYATPINWHFTAEEAGYILADSGAKALVAHADLWPAIAGAVPPALHVFLVPTPAEIARAYGVPAEAAVPPSGATLWDDWVARQPPLAGDTPPPPSSMIYTSGTTGRPKGVRRQRPRPEQLAMIRAYYAEVFGLAPDQGIVALMNGPFYHSSPNSYALTCSRLRIPMVLQPRFDAEEMLALIERHRVTHMHIVPAMFIRLLRLPEAVKRRYDLSSLRFVIHGAAPCPIHVKRAMIEWWGPVINEYYGSTENGITVFHTSEEALRKPGTVGRVLANSVLKVIGEDGRELPPREIGEIYTQQTFLTEFTYHHDDAKRREAARGDLVTVGDIGWIDEDGYVFLCDRKRDMIISGGVNIYPAEIEAALIAMPGVKDCAVFGIPDDEFGESVCAYIEVEHTAAPTAAAVRDFLAPRLAKYKIPKLIEIAERLPREDTGKIFKRKLRAPYWEKLGRSI